MADSVLIQIGLPIALAIIMCGLGMTLTADDFARVLRAPRAVIIALAVQVVILPTVAFGLVIAFDLPPLLAVGVMLLAASPGGTTASLLSHLFRGDVALNVTLTAINSVIAVVTIPFVTNLAIGYFDSGTQLGLQFGKILQVIAIVLIPVVIGMAIRRRSAAVADRADRPVRILSLVVLLGVCVGALIGERDNVVDYLARTGVVTVLFCVISLTIGYVVARVTRLGQRQAVATAMEVGVHNTTIALTIALSVLDSVDVAIPIAVYGVLMYPVALSFGFLITRVDRRTDIEVPGTTVR